MKPKHSSRIPTSLLMVVCGVLLFLPAFGALLAWQQGTLPAYLRGQIVRLYLTHLAPSLPFEVEALDYRATWTEIFHGTFPEIQLTLRLQPWRAHFKGPLQISWEPQGSLRFDFAPNVKLEHPRAKASSSPFPMTFHLGVDRHQIQELEIQLASTPFQWPDMGIDLKGLHFKASTPPQDPLQVEPQGKLQAQLEVQDLTWTEPPSGQPPAPGSLPDTLHITQIQFLGHAEGNLHWPPKIQPHLEFSLQSTQVESLFDGAYLDIPSKNLPLKGSLDWEPSPKVQLQLTLFKKFPIALTASLSSAHSPLSQGDLALEWKTGNIPVTKTLELILTATQSAGPAFSFLDPLRDLTLDGQIQSQGKLRTPLTVLNPFHMQSQFEGILEGKNLKGRWNSRSLAFQGLNLQLPFSSTRNTQGSLKLDSGYFKKLKIQLGPVTLKLRPQAPDHFWVNLEGATPDLTLPLQLAEIPLQIGKIRGEIQLKAEPVDFNFSTSLRLEPFNVLKLAPHFCLNPQSFFDLTLAGQFSQIEITPESIDTQGDLHLQAFEGSVDIDGIGVFDLNSSVPELDFNLDFNGIQMKKLGSWAKIGIMNGILEGYAHDVTFQSWLPTQYVFSADIKPRDRKDRVGFGPQAMKNFVTLFAGDELNELPGLVKWYAFGLPRKILGGYDIDYAGFTVISKDGITLIETHDPPLPKSDQHYLLSGKNFKMPLRSNSYPLMVDATAMSNYIHGLVLRFSTLQSAEESSPKKENLYEAFKKCLPPLEN